MCECDSRFARRGIPAHLQCLVIGTRTSPGDDRALLTIDLAAIIANWRQLAATAPTAEVAVSIKADAYGLGMAQVARALASAGAKTFFVATLEEGAALRAILPRVDIYLLNGLPAGGAARLLAHGLRPCLKSLADVTGWADAGAGQPAALHIDTGINRLGLGPDEVATLALDRRRLQGLAIALVMSHLARADEPEQAMNARQLASFHAAVGTLGLSSKPLSIAASSGIFLGLEFHLAMVRPGAALYGLAPLKDRPNPMRQAIKLEGKILQTRRVDTGMSVGYGATHLVRSPGRIVTVGIGYADGFSRALGNRGFAVLGDRRVPIVGRVSMDLMTLDASAVPAEAAMPGAMVELLGPGQSVDELAAAAGTIGYEILTALGRRFRRVYVENPEPGR
jgi:alanine racemase